VSKVISEGKEKNMFFLQTSAYLRRQLLIFFLHPYMNISNFASPFAAPSSEMTRLWAHNPQPFDLLLAINVHRRN